jgi:hypothetical protein
MVVSRQGVPKRHGGSFIGAEKPEETAAMIGTIETVPVPEKAV